MRFNYQIRIALVHQFDSPLGLIKAWKLMFERFVELVDPQHYLYWFSIHCPTPVKRDPRPCVPRSS
jgi:hypothetical protein